MKTFLFPGQGSQVKGMGGHLFDEYQDLVGKADEILGYSIKELCLDDPDGNLNQTLYTQPALYVVNALSYYKRLEDTGIEPDYLVGHSLGEFSALLCAGCYDFEEGLKIVKKRAELMSLLKDGAMAAILESSEGIVRDILNEANLTSIDLANFNTPSQIVISGKKSDIAVAESVFLEKEKVFVPLNTSGAFHSRYMEQASKEFRIFLNEKELRDLSIPVISNVTAKPYHNDNIVENMSTQISNAVRWSESMQYLLAIDGMEFEEIGTGDVLSGLLAQILAEGSKAGFSGKDQLEAKLEMSENSQIIWPIDQEGNSVTAEEKVVHWNKHFPVGSKVKSRIIGDEELETRTNAVVLFKHRAAVYVEGHNGYFDLDEIIPFS